MANFSQLQVRVSKFPKAVKECDSFRMGPSLSVAYSAQIELGFLARVRVWTTVDLVTGSSLDICLLMQISRGKLRPLSVSKIDTGLTY